MSEQKPINEFTMKDFKNFGIYIMIIGLYIFFVQGKLIFGGGIFVVGFIFTSIFQGPKIFKILKKKNW